VLVSTYGLTPSSTAGIQFDWQDDGFRLQGAETLSAPWYVLGVSSPVTLPAETAARIFHLLCD